MNLEPLLIFYTFFNFLNPDTLESTTAKFNISGAVDVYYAYDFNQPVNKDRQYTTQAARHNEFNINWAYIHLGYLDNRVRGNIALHTGTYAIFNYADEPNPILRMIAQANAGVKIARNVWVDAGVMPSHIGYENTLSAENEIYTRALMAENSPYFSTGFQLTAELSERFTTAFVILNGWQIITETNHAKSVGININFKPTSLIELNYSNYFGNEGNDLTGRKLRFFNHTYLKYFFTSKFHSAIAFDIGNQELLWSNSRRTWHTGMLVTHYRFTDKVSLAGRIEYYHDPYQIMIQTMTPNGFQTSSTTLNLNYAPTSNAIFRLEGRLYNSKDEVFYEGEVPREDNFLLVSSLTITF